ncbi:MAG TPA: CDP-glycerol glycerophosphotransferase family protein, partial [Clostridia bacterium]|nr:CDP-glycerol glycerophosphotransferase family protein [Clostridia bacterium]
MKLLISAVKLSLYVLYFLMKLRPVKNRVCMLSRQSNSVPLDFLLLEKELHRIDKDIEVKYVCELLDTKHAGAIRFLVNTVKCMNVLSTSKACVIDTYNIPVSILHHRKELKIAQIWHALGAVKKFGYQSLDSEGGRSSSFAALLLMHKNYSFITCASRATKELYIEAFQSAAEKILVIGMPRLDYITHGGEGKECAKETLYKKYPQLRNRINILYAPTFRENESVDFEVIINTIDFNKY